MTWVFGTATEFFGTAICVADIQVTIGDGEEREVIDCLQKVYPLAQNVVAGFAGNVQVGFSMLAALQEAVQEVVGEYGEPANFDRVLERFSPFATRVWGGLGAHLRKGGCELLVAGPAHALQQSSPRGPDAGADLRGGRDPSGHLGVDRLGRRCRRIPRRA